MHIRVAFAYIFIATQSEERDNDKRVQDDVWIYLAHLNPGGVVDRW